jgi:hypothetical protein
MKDNYILYINPNVEQTSWLLGWRFSEIYQWASWPWLVIKEHPASENTCWTNELENINWDFKITNLYIKNSEILDSYGCNKLNSDLDKKWYFSYIKFENNWWYINKYKDNGFVITMTYKASNINDLPNINSVYFNKKLSEMKDMISTLKLK